MAAFTIWAQAAGDATHNWGRTAEGVEGWVGDDQKWIRAALYNMKGKAAEWAGPYLIKISKNERAFPTWVEFEKAFRQRFMALDEEVEAKRELEALWMNKGMTAGEYTALFRQSASLTGWDDHALRDLYYSHLAEDIKDHLIHVEKSSRNTLDTLINKVLEFDQVRQERIQEKKLGTTSSWRNYSRPFASTTPSRDPDAMDIDATHSTPNTTRPVGNGKTYEDYQRALRGIWTMCAETSSEVLRKEGETAKTTE